ncbi:MAG: YidC/Oxa1 family membrane protein insertase [Erysipelotrichaceae bacterium]|nr:YidC/Oxa1 family membrane protein insertase [Erysipelotrichaceae bacterium]
MNKKRLTLAVSFICAVFLLSGCTVSNELIALDTPVAAVKNDGIFTVLLTYPLAQAINFISSKIGVFWGITIVTVALNAVVIALTFKSNVQMQKMQEIQPELQKIQLKYEGRTDNASKQRMAMELQNVYTKHGVNPMGPMLVTFIQLPVLFSMYAAVRRSSAVATGTFLGANLEMTPGQAWASKTWVIIAIYVLMIAAQFVSTGIIRWTQEARAKKEAEKRHKHYEKQPNSQAMMTYGMVGLIAVIMISWPTALSLYYLIYSVINIVKTIVIDKLTHKE